MSADPVGDVRAVLRDAIAALGAETSTEPTFERPPKAELGDYSSNAAMLIAKGLGDAPRAIAERLGSEVEAALADAAERVEVAGPGFLNLFLSDRWHRDAVVTILEAERFGAGAPREPEALLEFVSANPTGPLTAAGGRGAAYGDSLARTLEAAGHRVSREYYLNDAGTQIRLFAASIAARMKGEDLPDDGYSGEYVAELAAELADAGAGPEDLAELARRGAEAMRQRIEATLERFGVHFDVWSSERELLDRNALGQALDALAAAGHSYERDGALWLRTTDFGDDKDRVLVRSDGEPTYFGGDIAYHRDKLERTDGQLIVPLGADHHGYVARMKAAVAALGADPDRYEAPIMQLVNIVEGGERARMSKRQGEFVTLDELLDDIGVDAARFFMLQRSHDTALDLDLDLARKQSQDNPVYYVQYAHARIASILRKAEAEGGVPNVEAIAPAAASGAALNAACEPAERALVRRLLEFPTEIELAAGRRAPHRLTSYATAVAADFHGFYRDCRVVGADDEAGVLGLEAARLGVCLGAKRVIAETLGLVGTSAPDEM